MRYWIVHGFFLTKKTFETIPPYNYFSTYQHFLDAFALYTPEEILAAGGTTAFALKMGKDRDSLIKALEDAPKPEPFTDEEWADLMADLAKDK